MNRSYSKSRSALFLCATGATFVANQTQAFEAKDVLAFKIGPVSLRPHLGLSEQYNDNVLYRPSNQNPQSDFITTVSPGLALTLGKKTEIFPWMDPWAQYENYLTLDYTWDKSFYASESDLNASDHSLFVDNQLSGNRITLRGFDAAQYLTGTLGGSYNLGQTVKRTVQAHSYTLSYRFTEKIGAYLGGSFNSTDYERGTLLYDYNTVRGTLGFTYKAREKISLFGESYYSQSAVDPNHPLFPKGPHQETLGGFLGLRGELTTRIAGTVKAGYEVRQFSDDSPSQGSPVVDVAVRYRVSDRAAATLSYSRSTYVSAQVSSVSTTMDSINFDYTHKLGPTERWLVTGRGNYTLAEYDQNNIYALSGRQDNWLRAGVDLTYFIRLWLNTKLSYEYERFSSDATGQGIVDYDVNRVTIRLAVGY